MSRWSGKFDLFDHIAGMGGWFDKDGNEVKFGQENVNVYYSDELRDFEAFKKATGGVMYQNVKIGVDEYNQDFIKKHCSHFDYIKTVNEVVDKRCKEGKKEIVSYEYIYFDKKYTLKEINKKGVYISVPIHFETILDIIKYYPYIVTASGSSSGKQTVFISKESYVDTMHKEFLECGLESNREFYDKALAKHYIKVVDAYFQYELTRRTVLVHIKRKDLIKDENGDYIYKSEKPLDYMHEPRWINESVKTIRYAAPKIIDEFNIKISKHDVENTLKNDSDYIQMEIIYKPEEGFPIILN